MVNISVQKRSFLHRRLGDRGKLDSFRCLGVGYDIWYGLVCSKLCFCGLFP